MYNNNNRPRPVNLANPGEPGLKRGLLRKQTACTCKWRDVELDGENGCWSCGGKSRAGRPGAHGALSCCGREPRESSGLGPNNDIKAALMETLTTGASFKKMASQVEC